VIKVDILMDAVDKMRFAGRSPARTRCEAAKTCGFDGDHLETDRLVSLELPGYCSAEADLTLWPSGNLGLDL
jgi:hypothetical protein